MELNAAETIAFALFIGAMGKSAQALCCTPGCPTRWKARRRCRALIHAADQCDGRVVFLCLPDVADYRITRSTASAFIVIVGALSAFVAATIGLVQNDIKRVIGLFDDVAAWLHVRGRGRRRLLGVGDCSTSSPRAFFKAMLFSRGGQRDPRDASRAGHAATTAVWERRSPTPSGRC